MMAPTKWPRARVSEIANVVDYVANGSFASLKKNVTYKDEPDYAILVRLTDFNRGWSGPFVYVPEQSYRFLRKSSLAPGDIIVANVGAYAGTPFRAPRLDRPMTLGPNAVAVKTREGFHSDFYYYFLCSHLGQGLLHNITGGAAQPKFNKTDFRALEFPVPPLPSQKRIAGILSAYDELIENSQRRIRILEAMARALYREWFVNFRFPGHESHPLVSSPLGEIPEGWEVKKLSEIAENFDRFRKPLSKIKRSEMQGEYPYYGAAKVFDYINDFIFDGEYLLMAEDGSVITTERAPVLQLVKDKFWPNNHTHVLRGKAPFSTHFLYLGLGEVDISPYITGAAQPKITQANMNRIPFFCGPQELHEDFDRRVEPMIRQTQVLQRRVQNLRRTRDLLLPRLLSGQLKLDVA